MEQTRIYQIRAVARIEPLITSQLMGNFLTDQGNWQLTIDDAIKIRKTSKHKAYIAIDESNIDLGYLGEFIKRQPSRMIDLNLHFDFENEGYYKDGTLVLNKLSITIAMIPFELVPQTYQELIKIFSENKRNWWHQTYYWNYHKNLKQNIYEIQKTILRVNITTIGDNTWIDTEHGDNFYAISGIQDPSFSPNYVDGLYTGGTTTAGTLPNNDTVDSTSNAADAWWAHNQITHTIT